MIQYVSTRGVQRVPFSRVSRDHTAEFVCPAFSFSRKSRHFCQTFFQRTSEILANSSSTSKALWGFYLVRNSKSAESTGTVPSAVMRRVAPCAQSPVLLSTGRVTGPTSPKNGRITCSQDNQHDDLHYYARTGANE